LRAWRSRGRRHKSTRWCARSPTAYLLDELALYGHRPGQDEPNPRPLPEPDAVQAQLDNAVEALSAMLTGTRLEDDLDDLLWSFVNLFHRKLERIERELDSNEQAQRRGQAEQDGSEVKSVELERLIAQGISLIERRNAFEFVRDHAAELYEAATGSAWRPHTGSMVNHRALTAAVIDSREFLAARRRADTEVLAPSGTRINVTATLAIVPIEKTSDKAPDHRVYAGPRREVGAGWSQVAKSSGETYINLKIGSPDFGPTWVRCRLVKLEKPAEDGATHIALWEPRD
jgi:uncharacterized protein (DUF736 family)